MVRTSSRVRKSSPAKHSKNPQATPRRSRTHDTRTVKRSLASNQRAVFDWYEENQYRDDVGDIFSSKWQCRLTDWRNEFDPDTQNLHDRMLQLKEDPKTLELGLFFVAHSVAAFSLWHLLQACYELDKRICETSISQNKKLAEWQQWRPFQYLLSTDIVSEWGTHLDSLSTQVKPSTNIFKKEIAASRLLAMAEGVQVLEEALSIVTSVFMGKRKDMPCSFWMLDLIREGVDNRCRAIEKHITHH
ncbi:hypothetical protein DL98DRAFT_597440 [Cadophora sp. DSE1049]|nr:hypothetical protein DL98DRAFT_597440 [Cadophora sp. DSE1049]